MNKLYVTSALAALLATTAFADNAAPAEPVKAEAAKTEATDVKEVAVKAEEKVSDAIKPAGAKKDEPKEAKKHKADATHDHAAPEAKKAKTSHHKAHKGIPADAAELNGSTAVWNMPSAAEIKKEDADCKKACHEGKNHHHDAKHAEAAKPVVEALDAPKAEAVETKADAKTASHG